MLLEYILLNLHDPLIPLVLRVTIQQLTHRDGAELLGRRDAGDVRRVVEEVRLVEEYLDGDVTEGVDVHEFGAGELLLKD